MEIIKNAKWITSPVDAGAAAYTFRRDFALKGEVVKATLYASAMGIYVPMLNGRRVGDEILSPGWTSYKKSPSTSPAFTGARSSVWKML